MSPDGSDMFQGDGATLECSPVPWDTDIFGFPVAQISRFEVDDDGKPSGVLAAFDDWCADRGVLLISCRLDHGKLRESMALEATGFRFIETVYSPRFDRFETVVAPAHDVRWTEATEADMAPIEAIAYSAFTTGRFLLDGRLDPELSRRRYATWVQTSFGSAHQVVLKAEVGDELVGFFIVERRTDGSVYWHLTAIAPGWQGKGIGTSVWQAALLRHRAEGATAIETTISGHNLAVINLYARLGFTFASAQMTFHRLREPSA